MHTLIKRQEILLIVCISTHSATVWLMCWCWVILRILTATVLHSSALSPAFPSQTLHSAPGSRCPIACACQGSQTGPVGGSARKQTGIEWWAGGEGAQSDTGLFVQDRINEKVMVCVMNADEFVEFDEYWWLHWIAVDCVLVLSKPLPYNTTKMK